MQLIGLLLAFVLALALLRLAVIALALCLVIMVVWVAVTRPAQALTIIFFGVIGTLAEAYPAITLCLLAIMTAIYLFGKQ